MCSIAISTFLKFYLYKSIQRVWLIVEISTLAIFCECTKMSFYLESHYSRTSEANYYSNMISVACKCFWIKPKRYAIWWHHREPTSYRYVERKVMLVNKLMLTNLSMFLMTFFIFHESYKWRERGLISIHSLSTYKTCDQADD